MHSNIINTQYISKVIVLNVHLALSLSSLPLPPPHSSLLLTHHRESQSYFSLTVFSLTGAPGTGKSLVAQALGYEVGRPLKVIQLIVHTVHMHMYYLVSVFIYMYNVFTCTCACTVLSTYTCTCMMSCSGGELWRASEQVGGGEYKEH